MERKNFPIIMLPTCEAKRGDIVKRRTHVPKPLMQNESESLTDANTAWEPQHLYILDDSEIKKGDIVLSSFDKWTSTAIEMQPILGKVIEIKNDSYLIQYFQPRFSEMESLWDKGHSKKVIASTDPKLWKKCRTCGGKGRIAYGNNWFAPCSDCKYDKPGVARIPTDFIQAYIKAHNEGNPITEVALEMEQIGGVRNTGEGIHYWDVEPEEKLKLRPDGTVIVHKAKDDKKMYTEEDMKKAFHAGWKICHNDWCQEEGYAKNDTTYDDIKKSHNVKEDEDWLQQYNNQKTNSHANH